MDTESVNGTERGSKRDKKRSKGVLALARDIAAKEAYVSSVIVFAFLVLLNPDYYPDFIGSTLKLESASV